jgi:pyrroloquinoline quinone biosynthesis protein E
VLHRRNIDRLERLIAFAESLDAQRLELAHTQYLGWAFLNQGLLLPTRSQVVQGERIAQTAQQRLRGKMEILYVLPDYYSERPKPCLHGWGRRYLTVNPVGDVQPCQTASVIPNLEFANVRQHDLAWIWRESPAFQRFRGSAWMPEPCQSCPLHEVDFGGCRCQAFLLTGDATQTDPVCSLAPGHAQIQQLVQQTQTAPPELARSLRMRQNPEER